MEKLKISKKTIWFDSFLSTILTLLFIFDYFLTYNSGLTYRTLLLLLLGTFFALGMGHVCTTTALKFIRNHIYNEALKRDEIIEKIYVDTLSVPGWFLGFVERTFFGTLVAFEVSATAAGMLTWLLIKMATDWHKMIDAGSKNGPRSLAFGSLIAGMISLFFALIGGLMCRGALNP